MIDEKILAEILARLDARPSSEYWMFKHAASVLRGCLNERGYDSVELEPEGLPIAHKQAEQSSCGGSASLPIEAKRVPHQVELVSPKYPGRSLQWVVIEDGIITIIPDPSTGRTQAGPEEFDRLERELSSPYVRPALVPSERPSALSPGPIFSHIPNQGSVIEDDALLSAFGKMV